MSKKYWAKPDTFLYFLNIPSTVTRIDNGAFNNNQIINEEQAWIYKRTESGIDYSTLIGYAGANRNDISIPAEKNVVKLKAITSNDLSKLYFTGTLKIPITVTSIGQGVFYRNNVTYVDMGDGTLTDGFVYTKNQDGSVDYTNIVGDVKVNTAM